MIVSIHQPNFMPWMPFFQKIEKADIFVILQHCQYEKSNYQNRFLFKDTWYTMSANSGREPIIDKKYVNHIADWNRIKVKLSQYKNVLSLFDDCISESLSDTNCKIIERTVSMLGYKTKIVYDYPTELRATERLVDICRRNGATTYLAGSGGKNYMELEKFSSAGIDVIFQQEADMIKKHGFEFLMEKQNETCV
jgi:hypothetical protein